MLRLIFSATVLKYSFLFLGLSVGGLLIIKPRYFIQQSSVTDADDWSSFVLQVIGQLLVGMMLIPLIIKLQYWLYFS